ncbi:MAG TPA: class I SAM-dependent methyltransferase [Lacipirellulaceae bacterium]|nr:class I SAM-dependent methyltransferase [Lacipirellulaceae bacterium]
MEYTPEELKRIYQRRFNPQENIVRDRIWSVLVRNFFQAWIKPESVVVDLGCGFGEFLRHVNCQRRIGVDLNPQARESLSQAGIEHMQQSVFEPLPLAAESVDFVFTSNLMEHLPGKQACELMIREAHRLLKPDGHFVMMGPNIRVIRGEYWDFWDHIVPISDRSLVEALECLGFRIVNCWPRFLPYTTKSSLPKADWLVRTYLKCPWLWPIFGHQFLIRVTKF